MTISEQEQVPDASRRRLVKAIGRLLTGAVVFGPAVVVGTGAGPENHSHPQEAYTPRYPEWFKRWIRERRTVRRVLDPTSVESLRTLEQGGFSKNLDIDSADVRDLDITQGLELIDAELEFSLSTIRIFRNDLEGDLYQFCCTAQHGEWLVVSNIYLDVAQAQQLLQLLRNQGLGKVTDENMQEQQISRKGILQKWQEKQEVTFQRTIDDVTVTWVTDNLGVQEYPLLQGKIERGNVRLELAVAESGQPIVGVAFDAASSSAGLDWYHFWQAKIQHELALKETKEQGVFATRLHLGSLFKRQFRPLELGAGQAVPTAAQLNVILDSIMQFVHTNRLPQIAVAQAVRDAE